MVRSTKSSLSDLDGNGSARLSSSQARRYRVGRVSCEEVSGVEGGLEVRVEVVDEDEKAAEPWELKNDSQRLSVAS